MADKENQVVFVFIGSYGSVDDALMDYAAVKDLYHNGVIDTYDAAVVEKDADGNVHVHKHEKPTQKGAWTGIAVGAVVGVLFPPSIIASAAVGGVAGGLIGHVWHGMSRSDMKDLGEYLDAWDGGTRRRRQIQPGRKDRQGHRQGAKEDREAVERRCEGLRQAARSGVQSGPITSIDARQSDVFAWNTF